MDIRAVHSSFEAIARNIVYQQLNGTAAVAIHSRMLGLFGGDRIRPKNKLEAPDGDLHGAGLSRNIIMALRDLAPRTINSIVPIHTQLKRMDDEEIIERLTQVRA